MKGKKKAHNLAEICWDATENLCLLTAFLDFKIFWHVALVSSIYEAI